MFRRLFNPESDLMVVMGWITDLIFLSIFWMLACLPVITAGAATAALYDAAYYAFRRQDRHSWRRFIKSFTGSLKSSIIPLILVVASLIGMGKVMILLWNSAVLNGQWLVFAAVALVAVILLGILSLLFPMISRFENGLVQLLGNTVRLGLGHLPRTFMLGILSAVTIWLCVWYILPVFLMPCLSALLGTLFVEPMFRPFLPADFYEQPEEDTPEQ